MPGILCGRAPERAPFGVADMSLVEIRELRFGALSLRFALAHSGSVADHLGLPKAVPTEVRFLHEAQEIVIVYGALGEHRLDLQAIGTALLGYCLRARIPLSRRAAKSVLVLADAVVLTTRLEHDMPPEPVAAPVAAPTPRQMVWRR